jgi:hypothetical protein
MASVRPHARETGADQTPHQTEFPLRVPLCAWCHPNPPRGELVSHGICPRHLRKLKQEIARRAMHLSPTPRQRRQKKAPTPEPLLPLRPA